MPFLNKSEATKRSRDRKENGKCINATNRRSRVGLSTPACQTYQHSTNVKEHKAKITYSTNRINSILRRSLQNEHVTLRLILAKGRSDTHCKETLLIQELKPTLNDNVSAKNFICISLHLLYANIFSQLLSLLLLIVTYLKFKFSCYLYCKRSLLKMYVETYEMSS